MCTYEETTAKTFGKCVSCGETWRKFERYFQVKNNGKNVRGERYCLHCEDTLNLNNDIQPEDDAENRDERRREAYGSYRAMGNTQAFWTDNDAGLI